MEIVWRFVFYRVDPGDVVETARHPRGNTA
jgi:hypothetical protein